MYNVRIVETNIDHVELHSQLCCQFLPYVQDTENQTAFSHSSYRATRSSKK